MNRARMLLGLLLSFFCLGSAWAEMHVEKTIEKVPSQPEQVRPLLVGSSAPGVDLKKADGSAAPLASLLSQKPTVLVFYRGGWCPYCNKQLGNLKKIEDNLLKLGYQILAVSPDRPEKLAETRDQYKMAYQLLSDSDMSAAKAFGVAFQMETAAIERLKSMGKDLEDASGKDHHLLPVPAVFVIDADGIIQFQYANPNHRVRLDSGVLLAAAKAANSNAAPDQSSAPASASPSKN